MADVIAADSAIRFAPIPVATGALLGAESGVAVRQVEIVITAEDGSIVSVPCLLKHGAWWITAA